MLFCFLCQLFVAFGLKAQSLLVSSESDFSDGFEDRVTSDAF